MPHSSQYWIQHLNLTKHPEGGYFRETYRAPESIAQNVLPNRFSGPRSFSTAIYFLLSGNESSAFHRIRSDELWHFHTGSPLSLHLLHPDGAYERIVLGPHIQNNQTFQATVPADCWFGATVHNPQSYTLVSCTVAPGFDFADFELANRANLLAQYPQQQKLIQKLTSE
ncbi:MAG: cupin domain-containing protein [bacterium]|nr:cupin domain-containing protein [bacterium]